MQELGAALVGIIWLIISIFCWVFYHKMFRVFYFDLLNGIINEFIGSFIVGAILTALLIHFWYVAVCIIGGIAYIWYKKQNNV